LRIAGFQAHPENCGRYSTWNRIIIKEKGGFRFYKGLCQGKIRKCADDTYGHRPEILGGVWKGSAPDTGQQKTFFAQDGS
jgi:hypothetical protein